MAESKADFLYVIVPINILALNIFQTVKTVYVCVSAVANPSTPPSRRGAFSEGGIVDAFDLY